MDEGNTMNTTAPTRHDAGELSRIRTDLDAAKSLLQSRLTVLEHQQRMLEKAARRARIGVFECSLTDERLQWSDVVFDIFDMPRGVIPQRQTCVECYTEKSAAELKRRRDRAIRDRDGFSLDAEIVTPKGNRRWIRITAEVECDVRTPVRLFGLKQDITEEKILFDRTRYMAEFDVMTDLANRSRFQSALSDEAARTSDGDAVGALLLIDLDGFKAINDTHGHLAGDACLKEVARRLRSVSRNADLVARIGGDEFAVMLGSHIEPATAAAAAARIIECIRQPYEVNGERVRLGASIGIALSCEGKAQDLYMQADTALYAAKAAGRNSFRIFSPADAIAPRARRLGAALRIDPRLDVRQGAV